MAKKLLTFRAPLDVVSRLDQLAANNGKTRTDVIIFALEYLLEKGKDN